MVVVWIATTETQFLKFFNKFLKNFNKCAVIGSAVCVRWSGCVMVQKSVK
jgi:hypothetical protein